MIIFRPRNPVCADYYNSYIVSYVRTHINSRDKIEPNDKREFTIDIYEIFRVCSGVIKRLPSTYASYNVWKVIASDLGMPRFSWTPGTTDGTKYYSFRLWFNSDGGKVPIESVADESPYKRAGYLCVNGVRYDSLPNDKLFPIYMRRETSARMKTSDVERIVDNNGVLVKVSEKAVTHFSIGDTEVYIDPKLRTVWLRP
jgi:hypothetical protein